MSLIPKHPRTSLGLRSTNGDAKTKPGLYTSLRSQRPEHEGPLTVNSRAWLWAPASRSAGRAAAVTCGTVCGWHRFPARSLPQLTSTWKGVGDAAELLRAWEPDATVSREFLVPEPIVLQLLRVGGVLPAIGAGDDRTLPAQAPFSHRLAGHALCGLHCT